MQAGIIAAAMANAWLKKKSGESFAPADFMPDFDGAARDGPSGRASGRDQMTDVDSLTPAERVAWLEMMNAVYRGRDLRGK